jgi:predicted MFS family arabinose efflux permease
MIQQTIQLYRSAYGGISRTIWLMALVMFINRSGSMVIPFMTVYLTQQLHFSLQQAGMVMSCFGTGALVGVFMGGRLTDRFGHFWVQFWSLLLGGLMFLVLMQMRTLPSICVVIFTMSAVGEAFRPANTTSIAHYSTPENRTRSYSLNRLAINLGWSLGPALGGFMATLGYQYLFMADGLTCIGAAALLWLFVRKVAHTNSDPALNTDEGTPAFESLPHSAYRDTIFLAFIGFTVLYATTFLQFFTVVPVYLKTHLHFSELRIGGLLALNGLLVALFEMLFIYRIEGRYRKLTFIAWGTALCSVSYLLLLLDSWAWIPLVIVLTLTFSEMLAMPFMNTFTIERSTPSTRGQYTALYSMTYSLAHVFAPTIGAQVAANWGFHGLWWVLAGMSGGAVFGFWWLGKRVVD